jgi:hypothetical protein
VAGGAANVATLVWYIVFMMRQQRVRRLLLLKNSLINSLLAGNLGSGAVVVQLYRESPENSLNFQAPPAN